MPITLEHSADIWTLTEAARLLGEPQHRLIYLCEKGVVEPDIQDAEGRGSSRRFSNRNLLEFALALRLRDLELPATLIGAVVHVMRAFEAAAAKELRGYRPPDSLQATHAPRSVLGHMVRIGRRAIVSFPNFGHWRLRLHLLLHGRMPVSPSLPGSWHATANIHLCTIRDFLDLCEDLGISVERFAALDGRGQDKGYTSPWRANLAAENALFLLSRKDSG